MSGRPPRRYRTASLVIFVLAGPIPLAACSTSKVVLNDADFHAHSSLDFETVRFRRPDSAPWSAETARTDAAGNPVVEAPKALGNLDCERSEEFFAKLNLSAIRRCFAKLSTPPPKGAEAKRFELEWNLKKEGQPVLALRNPEAAPECVRAALPEMPFPRELVYVVPSESPERGECFTSRISLDPGDVLGWELPRARIRLRIEFPLRENPRKERDVERLLRSWILSVFRGGPREGGSFHGRLLPTRYCVKCLGIPENPERGAPTVPAPITLWPSRESREAVRSGSDSDL